MSSSFAGFVRYPGIVRWALLGLILAACGQTSAGHDAGLDGRIDAFVFTDIDARLQGGQAELGTGISDFVSITDEQELGLVHGPQGGYHFFLDARIQEMQPGMDGEILTFPGTVFEIFLADGTRIDILQGPLYVAYIADPSVPGAYVLPLPAAIQIEKETVPAIYDTRVRIALRVWDQEGRVASDERWVVAVPYSGADAGP